MSQDGPRAPLPPEEVQRALDDVLSRGEVRRAAFWREVGDWIEEVLDGLLRPFGGAGSILLWIVAIALVGLLLWVLFAILRARRTRREAAASGAGADVEARLAALRRRAEEALAAEDAALALRLWLAALLVGLGEAGELDYRDAWTARELVERGRPSPAVRARLAPLLDELDEASFSGRPVERDDALRVRGLVEGWLAEARP